MQIVSMLLVATTVSVSKDIMSSTVELFAVRIIIIISLQCFIEFEYTS